jgi:hypothetical protein
MFVIPDNAYTEASEVTNNRLNADEQEVVNYDSVG